MRGKHEGEMYRLLEEINAIAIGDETRKWHIADWSALLLE